MDEMLEIVKCSCDRSEYYGMMHWYNGHQYCRVCTYERWQNARFYTWKPGSTDYVFPLYIDGIDYTKQEDKE
jgi:hypothetical protein